MFFCLCKCFCMFAAVSDWGCFKTRPPSLTSPVIMSSDWLAAASSSVSNVLWSTTLDPKFPSACGWVDDKWLFIFSWTAPIKLFVFGFVHWSKLVLFGSASCCQIHLGDCHRGDPAPPPGFGLIDDSCPVCSSSASHLHSDICFQSTCCTTESLYEAALPPSSWFITGPTSRGLNSDRLWARLVLITDRTSWPWCRNCSFKLGRPSAACDPAVFTTYDCTD